MSTDEIYRTAVSPGGGHHGGLVGCAGGVDGTEERVYCGNTYALGDL